MIEFQIIAARMTRPGEPCGSGGTTGALEATFFIEEGALRRIQPDARPDEPGFLNAFDCNHDVICAAAAKVYVRGSRGSYDLVAADFRK
jgi:hypothetical protein